MPGNTTSPSPHLDRAFFDRHHLDVARDLIGAALVWHGCGGTVVETEAYAAEGDPACHTATRPSSRTFFEHHPPGTAYVYLNYGVHWLLNVLAADGIVLLRALEPTSGISTMQRRRKKTELTSLCSGPGKIGGALGLGKADHGKRLTGLHCRGFRPAEGAPLPVVTDRRIGISQAIDFPWRFLVPGNPHVSVPKK